MPSKKVRKLGHIRKTIKSRSNVFAKDEKMSPVFYNLLYKQSVILYFTKNYIYSFYYWLSRARQSRENVSVFLINISNGELKENTLKTTTNKIAVE